MVSSHDAVREDASPVPVPALPATAWNAALELSAQAHADLCVFSHSGLPGVGENLYASTGSPNTRPSPATDVASWAGEQAFYDYATNTCAAGQQCGNYKQIVFRTATQVGCGVEECDASTSPFPPPFDQFDWYIWVCQYQSGQTSGRPYLCDHDGNGVATDLCNDTLFADGFESGDPVPGPARSPEDTTNAEPCRRGPPNRAVRPAGVTGCRRPRAGRGRVHSARHRPQRTDRLRRPARRRAPSLHRPAER